MYSPLLSIHLESSLFPYTTLFRSQVDRIAVADEFAHELAVLLQPCNARLDAFGLDRYLVVGQQTYRRLHQLLHRDEGMPIVQIRSEEHTSELQSRFDLVCRLLLEK